MKAEMAHRRQKRVVVARVNVFLEGSRCMVVVVERKEEKRRRTQGLRYLRKKFRTWHTC